MPTLNWIGKDAVVRHHQDVPFRPIELAADLICTAAKGMGARATREGITFRQTLYALDT
ncbi:MAG: hypothetical protein J0M13_12760 [Candidatus Accumulibacter sp.]|nr:hypothetical protein [Candidatus Accumulibacter necessarius]